MRKMTGFMTLFFTALIFLSLVMIMSRDQANAQQHSGFSYTFEETIRRTTCGLDRLIDSSVIKMYRNGKLMAIIVHPINEWYPEAHPELACLDSGRIRKDQWVADCEGVGRYNWGDTKEEVIEWAKRECRR